jgi:hypothetical protein
MRLMIGGIRDIGLEGEDYNAEHDRARIPTVIDPKSRVK